jgi:hypothetical protein
MMNNFCEEQRMEDKVLEFHEQELKNWDIPAFVANIKCPFCNTDMPLRSIRSIALKLNARNLGDIAVEVFCPHCSKMDTVYFRKAADCVDAFFSLLTGGYAPLTEPIIEEEMYKLQYNNVVEKMMGVKDVDDKKR